MESCVEQSYVFPFLRLDGVYQIFFIMWANLFCSNLQSNFL